MLSLLCSSLPVPKPPVCMLFAVDSSFLLLEFIYADFILYFLYFPHVLFIVLVRFPRTVLLNGITSLILSFLFFVILKIQIILIGNNFCCSSINFYFAFKFQNSASYSLLLHFYYLLTYLLFLYYYRINGGVIAAQCTVTFLRSIVLPRI